MSNTTSLPALRSFRFYSADGADFGVYEGHTPAEALAVLHSDAGYHRGEVRVSMPDREELIFASPETEALLGGLDRWTAVDLGECPKARR